MALETEGPAWGQTAGSGELRHSLIDVAAQLGLTGDPRKRLTDLFLNRFPNFHQTRMVFAGYNPPG